MREIARGKKMCASNGTHGTNSPLAGQLYGIEKYWAFLKYYKSAKQLPVEPRLKELLAGFKTVEDFRVLEPEINEMLQGVGTLRTSPDKRRIRSISESEGTAKAVHQQPRGQQFRSGAGASGWSSSHHGNGNERTAAESFNSNSSKYRKR